VGVERVRVVDKFEGSRMFLWVIGGMRVSVVGEGDNRHVGPREWRRVISKGERASRNYIPIQMSTQPHAAQVWARAWALARNLKKDPSNSRLR
jgi:hypothetical protein